MILIWVTGLLTAAYAQNNADGILGKWANEDNTRVIEFVKSGTGYEAVIRQAPDPGMVGKKQLTGVLYNNGSYAGNVLLPKKGKSFPCTLTFKADSTLELRARAGFISKQQVWARVKQ